VPNWGSLQARLFRARWFHYQLPGHLFHFTPRALTMLLERNGFRVARRYRHSPDHGYFAMLVSLGNLLSGTENGLMLALKPGAASERGGRIGRAARGLGLLGLVALVGLPFLAAEFAASLLGAGGEIEMYAVRE
jgi:hypothetical protein